MSIQYLFSGLSEIFAKIMLPLFGKSKCHTNREGQSLVGQVNKFSCKTKLAFTTNVGIPFPELKKQLDKHFVQKYFLFQS